MSSAEDILVPKLLAVFMTYSVHTAGQCNFAPLKTHKVNSKRICNKMTESLNVKHGTVDPCIYI